jgi:sugar-specific transcriptional regulator TrmB
MFKNEDVKTLTRLGLTGSQAKVYIALTKVEDSTIKTISQNTKIARQDIYRILSQLQEEICLVERILATPSRYRAIPIVEGTAILAQRRQKENAETQTKALQLIQRHQDKKMKNETQQEYQFVLIPPKEACFRIRQALLDKAQTSVDLLTSYENAVSSPRLFTHPQEREKLFGKFLRKGGKIRLLVCNLKEEEKDKLREAYKYFEHKSSYGLKYTTKGILNSLAIFDGKELIINSVVETRPENVPNLWAKSPIIVGIIAQYFEQEWNEASELWERLK